MDEGTSDPDNAGLKPTFHRSIPPMDDVERDVCSHCGYVAYQNPKIVAGSVARASDGRILMCRRAIEPRRGFWTLPAGYLELNESPEQGALREAREEANAELALGPLLGVYTVHRLSQVQLIFRATLLNEPRAGPESLEVALFAPEDIPTDDLAFPTVHWALQHDFAVESGAISGPSFNPADGSTDLPE